MSIIKSQEDLKNLKYSCRILMSCHKQIESLVKPGVTGEELNRFAIEFGKKYNARPNFLGYDGYKYAINFSINDEVVHGFPTKDKIIPEKGLVKIDMGFVYKGMHSDAAKTYIVGEVKKLNQVTKEALMAGIRKIKNGVRVGDIGLAIGQIADKNNYGNVKNFGGHGLGYKLHDDPFVPNYGRKGVGSKLFVNKFIAVEPMFTLGSSDVYIDKEDGWTVKTVDGSWATHWEHDILITDKGCEVLTDIPDSELLE